MGLHVPSDLVGPNACPSLASAPRRVVRSARFCRAAVWSVVCRCRDDVVLRCVVSRTSVRRLVRVPAGPLFDGTPLRARRDSARRFERNEISDGRIEAMCLAGSSRARLQPSSPLPLPVRTRSLPPRSNSPPLVRGVDEQTYRLPSSGDRHLSLASATTTMPVPRGPFHPSGNRGRVPRRTVRRPTERGKRVCSPPPRMCVRERARACARRRMTTRTNTRPTDCRQTAVRYQIAVLTLSNAKTPVGVRRHSTEGSDCSQCQWQCERAGKDRCERNRPSV